MKTKVIFEQIESEYIADLIRNGNKLDAVKFCKAAFGLSLIDAKRLAEKLAEGNTKHYRVLNLINRTKPYIGSILKEDEVQYLMREDRNLTVEIKPFKSKDSTQ